MEQTIARVRGLAFSGLPQENCLDIPLELRPTNVQIKWFAAAQFNDPRGNAVGRIPITSLPSAEDVLMIFADIRQFLTKICPAAEGTSPHKLLEACAKIALDPNLIERVLVRVDGWLMAVFDKLPCVNSKMPWWQGNMALQVVAPDHFGPQCELNIKLMLLDDGLTKIQILHSNPNAK